MKNLRIFSLVLLAGSLLGFAGSGCGSDSSLSNGNDEVTVVTGDVLSFGTPVKVNDVPLPNFVLQQEFFEFGMGKRISAVNGSIHVNLVWARENPEDTVRALFDHEVDLMGFGPDVDIAAGDPLNHAPLATLTFSDLNPGVVGLSQFVGDQIRAQFFLSEDQGASFSTISQLDTSDPTFNHYEAIAQLDNEDNIHATYLVQDPAFPTDFSLRYVKSTDRGTSWSTPMDLGNLPNIQFLPDIAVSKDGQRIFICYTENPAALMRDVKLVRSLDGGDSFLPAIPITSSGVGSFCRVALDPDGNVFVSYAEEAGGFTYNIMVAKSTDNGANFGPGVQANSETTENDGVFPYLAIDPLGRIDMVWGAKINGEAEVPSLMYTRSIDGGTTFYPEIQIDGMGAETKVAAMGLAHDETGRLHVQYRSNVNNPAGMTHDIFYLVGE